MSDANAGGVSAEQMVAAFDRIADAVAQAYEAARIVAEKFSRIAQEIAANWKPSTSWRPPCAGRRCTTAPSMSAANTPRS